MVYCISVSKKGIYSIQLSRKLQLRQKICWLFKQKVMQVMASIGNHPLKGKVEVDEFILEGQEKIQEAGRIEVRS